MSSIIRDYPKFGPGIGLNKVMRCFELLDIDPDFFSRRSIFVTGSNGKGSTSYFIKEILCQHYDTVGHFSSPHLWKVNERFVKNDQCISDRKLEELWKTIDEVQRELPESDKLGQFEAFFLVAIIWFYELGVDAIVWEAGIGGRYDPTRTLKAKVGALTSIELEHTRLLGNTEELIAYDKVDGVFPGGEISVSQLIEGDLREKINSYCQLSNKKISQNYFSLERYDLSESGTTIVLKTSEHDIFETTLKMVGNFQAYSAALALNTSKVFLEKDDKDFDARKSMNALKLARWPGRLEKISGQPSTWIDVGHTQIALRSVVETYSTFERWEDTIIVFGVSFNKEFQKMAQLIEGLDAEVIITRANHNGKDPAELRKCFGGKGNYTVISDVADAVRISQKMASEKNKSVIVLGGLFLAVEYAQILKGGSIQDLDFF